MHNSAYKTPNGVILIGTRHYACTLNGRLSILSATISVLEVGVQVHTSTLCQKHSFNPLDGNNHKTFHIILKSIIPISK